MNIEEAVRTIAEHCKVQLLCEGCRFYGTNEVCFFALCDLPCDWKIKREEESEDENR